MVELYEKTDIFNMLDNANAYLSQGNLHGAVNLAAAVEDVLNDQNTRTAYLGNRERDVPALLKRAAYIKSKANLEILSQVAEGGVY